MTTDATDILYRTLFHEGLCLAAEASGGAMSVRRIYRAAVLDSNPRYALAIIREVHAKLDATGAQLANFRTGILGIAADLEASLQPVPEPTP